MEWKKGLHKVIQDNGVEREVHKTIYTNRVHKKNYTKLPRQSSEEERLHKTVEAIKWREITQHYPG